MKAIVRDSGWAKQIKDLLTLRQATVGIHQAVDGRDGESLGNAQIGHIHEYGLGNSPQRSFLRSTFDEKRDAYIRLFRLSFSRAAHGLCTGKEAVEFVAMKAVADVKRKIRSNIPPPLAESTVERKGSSTALIDTGQLINAIDYEVK